MMKELSRQYLREFVKGFLTLVVILLVVVALEKVPDLIGHSKGDTDRTKVSVQEIVDLLEHGEYPRAVSKLGSHERPELQKLYEQLNQPVRFTELSFFSEDSPENWRFRKIEAVTPETVKLRTGSGYGLRFTPEQDCHLYILQMDASDRIWLIFPNDDEKGWNTQPEAALIAKRTYQAPGDGRAYTLEEVTGEERIILVSAPWKCRDIEETYQKYRLERDSSGAEQRNALRDELLQRVDQRKNDRFESTFFSEFRFEHLPQH